MPDDDQTATSVTTPSLTSIRKSTHSILHSTKAHTPTHKHTRRRSQNQRDSQQLTEMRRPRSSFRIPPQLNRTPPAHSLARATISRSRSRKPIVLLHHPPSSLSTLSRGLPPTVTIASLLHARPGPPPTKPYLKSTALGKSRHRATPILARLMRDSRTRPPPEHPTRAPPPGTLLRERLAAPMAAQEPPPVRALRQQRRSERKPPRSVQQDAMRARNGRRLPGLAHTRARERKGTTQSRLSPPRAPLPAPSFPSAPSFSFYPPPNGSRGPPSHPLCPLHPAPVCASHGERCTTPSPHSKASGRVGVGNRGGSAYGMHTRKPSSSLQNPANYLWRRYISHRDSYTNSR